MPAAASWRVPRPCGQRLVELACGGEVAARAQDHAVAPDDERAVDGREFLDRLLEPGVEHVALVLGVAVERVDDQLVALGQDAVAVAERRRACRRDVPRAPPGRARWPGSAAARRRPGVDVGGERVGGRVGEHLDLGPQVEHDDRVDRPRAVDPGQADDPVARCGQALGRGDQRGHLDLPGAGHRDVGHADDRAAARPSPGRLELGAPRDQDHAEVDVLDQGGRSWSSSTTSA